MAVTSVKRQWRGRAYRADAQRRETIPCQWLITTDSRTDGPKYIIAQAQLASWGDEKLLKQYDPYSFGGDGDGFMLAKDLSLELVPESDSVWLATINFDNTIDPGQSADDPLDRLPIDDWDFEQFDRVCEKDIDGNAITNSAGDPYDPPLTKDDSRPILIYTRNESTYPSAFVTHQDTINSDGFLIFDPYQAKVNIKATKVFEGNYRYYRVSYIIHFRRDGWRKEILNRGLRFKISGTDTGSVPLPAESTPILLDEDGTPLATDGSQDPTYKEHKIYDEVAFAPLGIVIY